MHVLYWSMRPRTWISPHTGLLSSRITLELVVTISFCSHRWISISPLRLVTHILNKLKNSSSVISTLDECVFVHFEHLVWILRYMVMLSPRYHLYTEHVGYNIYRGTKDSESNNYSGSSSVMYSSV